MTGRVTLGGTDLEISRLVLGTMTFGGQTDASEAARMVDAAREAGIDMLDTANVYTGGESERIVGRLIAPMRDEVVLATKVGARYGPGPLDGGLSAPAVRRAVDASLDRLKTDRIDLLYLHMPDWTVDVRETIEAVHELMERGKVRNIGHSNFAAWQIAEMVLAVDERLRTAQQQLNLVSRSLEDEYATCSHRFGLSTLVYNPLAGGLLTGKHRPDSEPTPGTRFALAGYRTRYWHPSMFEAVEHLRRIGADTGMSLPELSLRWLLGHPIVAAVIVGASSLPQLLENLEAATGPPPIPEVVALLDEVWEDLRGRIPRYNR